MKWGYLLAGAALTLCFGLPFREYNTETLLPLHYLQVAKASGEVRIVSDVGEGRGKSWKTAVEDLKRNASGDVFFHTAEQVICCAPELLPEIAESGLVRPAAQVYFAKELQELEELSDYLSAHESGWTIADVRGGRT